jgi:general secretion pathway protein G
VTTLRRSDRSRRGGQSGFTLIELVTVIALVAILAGVALPQFRASVILAKEAVLKEDLFRFRDLIDQYHADKGHYPESLEALVTDGYLRRIPKDPISGVPEWEVIYEDIDPDNPVEVIGVYDVRSKAPGLAMDGTYYAEW